MNLDSRCFRVCTVCCALTAFGGSPGGASEAAPELPNPVELTILGPKLNTMKAVDITVVIDNSSSMGAEISALEDTLYDHLVAPLSAQNIAPRVIVISSHGDNASESTCFETPLSTVPDGGCATPPAQPGINDIFKHYSLEVGSEDGWCLLQSTYDGTIPDSFGLAPTGWSEWLREGSLKVILVVSDDGVVCDAYDDGDSAAGGTTAAAAIDGDLLALSSNHFGSAANRNYVTHSLVGLAANNPSDEPWPPGSPISESLCAGAVDAGTGHQGLSRLTGGLRFPVCATTDYGLFLDDVALDTIVRVPIFADGFENGDDDGWSASVP